MSGRGITVVVQVLHASSVKDRADGTDGVDDDISEEISLNVALHTPLSVFKHRLEEISGIFANDQVLILCDLTDPNRNSDVHLNEDYNNLPLRDCRIRNGSVLTIHALGISAEKRAKLLKESDAQKEMRKAEQRRKTEGTAVLTTPVSAANADHSFNGIIFDIEARGAHEVEIYSLSVGGMLGTVRIFARDRPWRSDAPEPGATSYWGHHPGVSRHGWTLVAEQVCRPAWDRATEIFFKSSFRLLPHSRHGFYIHSALPDDLGIQYQSCDPKSIVCEDSCITVHPGLGHCGNEPFDKVHGWYRHGRQPCGSIRYKARFKGWNKKEHNIFPKALRDAAKTMLAVYYSATNAASPLSSSSPRYRPPTPHAAATVIQRDQNVKESTKSDMLCTSRSTGSQSDLSAADENEMDEMFGSAQNESDLEEDSRNDDAGENKHAISALACQTSDTSLHGSTLTSTMKATTAVSPVALSLQFPAPNLAEYKIPAISVLNERYLIYKIMEYCHWDWFLEVEEARQREAETQRRLLARQSAASAAEERAARGGMVTRSMSVHAPSRDEQLRQMVIQILESYGVEDISEDLISSFLRNMAHTSVGDDNSEDEDEDDTQDDNDASSEEEHPGRSRWGLLGDADEEEAEDSVYDDEEYYDDLNADDGIVRRPSDSQTDEDIYDIHQHSGSEQISDTWAGDDRDNSQQDEFSGDDSESEGDE